MTTELLESRIRTVLDHQAERIAVPPPRPIVPGDPDRWSPSLRRGLRGSPAGTSRPLLLTACAVVAVSVAIGAVAIVRDGSTATIDPAGDPARPDGVAADAATPAAHLDLDTGVGVRLRASSLTVETDGRTFQAPTASVDDGLEVHGDPGISPDDPAGGYTSLELSWFEDDIEMRVNLYFASDGTDWWVSEIRTYDGAPAGEWTTATTTISGPTTITADGDEWFRSPLGQPYVGDIDVGPLHVADAELEAFTPPATSCDGSGTPGELMIDPGVNDVIERLDAPEASVTGHAFVVVVRDAATCQPVPLDDLRIDAVADDGTPVAADWTDRASMPGPHTGEVDLSFDFASDTGPSSIRIEAIDPSDRVVATLDVPVVMADR